MPYIHGLWGWAEFGQPLAALWEEFLDEVRADGLELKSLLNAEGLSPTKPLIEIKQMSGARFIDDESSLAIGRRWMEVPFASTTLVLKKSPFGTRYLQRPFWFESGRSGVFPKRHHQRFNNYADLYVLDLETKKIQKLRMNLYLRRKVYGREIRR